MTRDDRVELKSRIVRAGRRIVGDSPRRSPVDGIPGARLRFVAAVRVTFETDFVFVDRRPARCGPGAGIHPARPQERRLDPRRDG